jgi:hypothetical protein
VGLYPNPSTGQLTLSLDAGGSGPLALDWYDAQGRLIASERHSLPAGRSEIEIDRSSWPPGLYLWRARRGSQQAQGKLMLHTN